MLFKAVMLGLAVLGFGAGSVWACSCLPAPTVQDEFERSGVVVRVRLERIEDLKPAPEADPWAVTAKAVMRLVRVYKGDLVAGETIDVAQGNGAMCGISYSEEYKGQDFLLYMGPANAETKMFAGSICGRARHISDAAVDLNYLERRGKLEGKTLLMGMIYGGGQSKPDHAVTVRGAGRTYRTRTDKDGYFEIVGLQPGRYMVEVSGEISYFYFAPSAKGISGEHGRPTGGAAAVNVKAGKLTELTIYLK